MRERPLVALAGGAVLGVLAERAGAPVWILAGAGLLLTLAIVRCVRRDRAVAAGVLLVAVLVAAVAHGRHAALEAGRTRRAEAWIEWDGGPARLRIVEAPILLRPPPDARDPDRLALVAELLAPQPTDSDAGRPPRPMRREGRLPQRLVGARVRLYLDADEADDPAAWRPGSVFLAEVRPGGGRPPAWPGAFDAGDLHARTGVCGAGGAERFRLVRAADPHHPGVLLFRLRRALVRAVHAAYDAPAEHVLAAVLLGYRDGVNPSLRAPFRRTGTGHLLAVSGLHVGLVTGLAWLLARRMRAGPRGAAVVAMGVCLLYLGLTGGRPSAVRAGVMAMLFLGGFLVARRSDLLNALAAAALLIILHHPPVVTDAGFQLSFTAVLFLSRLGGELHILRRFAPAGDAADDPPLRARVRRRLDNVLGLFLLAVAAWVGLWPLSATYFHLLSFGSLALNVVAIPWLSVVLVAGLAGLPAAALPAWAGGWAVLCQAPMDLLLALTERAAAVPWLAWPTPPPAPWAMALYYGGFVLFFARRAAPEKWIGHVRTGAALTVATAVVAMIATMRPAPPPDTVRLTVLPAGVGECVVAELPDGRVAVVGHIRRSGMDAVDYLRATGRDRVDAVVRVPHPFEAEEPPHLLREQFGEGEDAFRELVLPRRRPRAGTDRKPLLPDENAEGRRPDAPARTDRRNESAPQAAWSGGALPGLPEVELLPVWHRWDGTLAGWVVRAGGAAVLVGEWEHARPLVWSMDGADRFPPLDAAVLHPADRSWPEDLRLDGGALTLEREDYRPRVRCRGPVLADPRQGVDPQPPVLDRDRFGAVRITAGSAAAGPGRRRSRPRVEAFDGDAWRNIRPRDSRSAGRTGY